MRDAPVSPIFIFNCTSVPTMMRLACLYLSKPMVSVSRQKISHVHWSRGPSNLGVGEAVNKLRRSLKLQKKHFFRFTSNFTSNDKLCPPFGQITNCALICFHPGINPSQIGLLYQLVLLYYERAPAGSRIFNPGISGTGFCKIPGSRDFSGRD